MKTRWPLAVVPVLGGLLVGLVCHVFGPQVPSLILQVNDGVVFALACVASAAVAQAFSAGDYLRRAWVLMSLCYGLLLLDVVFFGVATPVHPREISDTGALISGALTLVANLVTVTSLIIVARAWQVAGLSLQASRRDFIIVESLIVIFALVLLGPTVLRQFTDATHGKVDELHQLASTLGDVVSIVVMGPLMLTALSLRGGSLAWPWGLLTVSTLCWLGVDGAEALGDQLQLSGPVLVVISESVRAVASLLQVSAALAQRSALRS